MTITTKTVTVSYQMKIDPARLQPAIDFIADNYHQNPLLAEIASTCGMSKYHFLRVYKMTFGNTPRAAVFALQIQEAKRLLLCGEKLDNIARAIGFASASHFCNRFRKEVGMTPGKWREQQGKEVKS